MATGQEYLLDVDSAFVTGLSARCGTAPSTRSLGVRRWKAGALFLLIPDAERCGGPATFNGCRAASADGFR